MRKAERALTAAQLILKAGDANGTCNRVYCAMYEAAHAALRAAGVALPPGPIKSHRALVSLFGEHLVRPKQIDAKHGAALNEVLNLFLLADYHDHPLGIDHAARALELATAFIVAIRAKFSL
jgi:uncharacterized protein (UPF0332 family)